MTVKELLPYYKKINKLLHDKDYEEVNKIFNSIDVAETDATLLMGILRLTYIYKVILSSWVPLRDKVEIELDRRGLDSESILEGLLIFS